jgi:UDP-2,3-diacylglucosamine pyrophosphatase LpxH
MPLKSERMPSLNEFDRFYIVSDLHLGGLAGFQIFQQGSNLVSFIDWVTGLNRSERVGLCINGDTVDFLAEPNARYFDPDGAGAKLDRIFNEQSFQPVWQSLQRLVATPNRRLILTLGNHDIELALPWVREQLLQFLAQGKDDASGRVTLSFDGTGYRCTVGGKSVLCLHGNEFDPWNLTDHEHGRRIARDFMQGRAIADWTPNAGSKLVIDVMNDIKRQYAFVDVLKPEVEAVLPILWVLDEATRSRISRVASVSQRLTWDVIRKATGFLSAGESQTNESLELVESSNSTFYKPSFDPQQIDSDRMLDWVERQVEAGTDPLTLVDGGSDQLGMAGAFWDRVQSRPRQEQAWEALKDLAGDKTFDLSHEDYTFQRADKFVGQSIDYLVTGHTHQARALQRRHGMGRYYNSGTWATLMHLTSDQLRSAENFAPVFQRLAGASTLGALAGLVEQRPTVVSIVKNADGSATGLLSLFKVENGSPIFQKLCG